jgi:hypothetical protein
VETTHLPSDTAQVKKSAHCSQYCHQPGKGSQNISRAMFILFQATGHTTNYDGGKAQNGNPHQPTLKSTSKVQ